MSRWVQDPFGFVTACRAQFGPTFTLQLFGFGPSVFTDDPDLVHAIFTAPTDALHGGKGNDILLPFLGPRSMLTMDGPPHARDRKLMTPPFHGQRMRAYGGIVEAAALSATRDWRPRMTLSAQPVMQHISLEVILRAVFGLQTGLAEARVAITRLLGTVGPAMMFFEPLRWDLGRWSPGGRYRAVRAQTDAMLRNAIAARRAEPGEDILSLLLAARDEHGEPLPEADIEAELVTLLLAGHETTANALSWALAWLAAEQEVQAKLVEELAGASDLDGLSKLPYLSAVCNEVLRLYPVFPIVMRVAAKPWSHSGVSINVGDRIAPCIYLVHQREDLYPEPMRFRPERFLERHFAPHEHLPFGGGARRCIGMAFALFEMKIVLATLLRNHRIAPGPRPIPERRNIAIGPQHGARVTLA